MKYFIIWTLTLILTLSAWTMNSFNTENLFDSYNFTDNGNTPKLIRELIVLVVKINLNFYHEPNHDIVEKIEKALSVLEGKDLFNELGKYHKKGLAGFLKEIFSRLNERLLLEENNIKITYLLRLYKTQFNEELNDAFMRLKDSDKVPLLLMRIEDYLGEKNSHEIIVEILDSINSNFNNYNNQKDVNYERLLEKLKNYQMLENDLTNISLLVLVLAKLEDKVLDGFIEYIIDKEYKSSNFTEKISKIIENINTYKGKNFEYTTTILSKNAQEFVKKNHSVLTTGKIARSSKVILTKRNLVHEIKRILVALLGEDYKKFENEINITNPSLQPTAPLAFNQETKKGNTKGAKPKANNSRNAKNKFNNQEKPTNNFTPDWQDLYLQIKKELDNTKNENNRLTKKNTGLLEENTILREKISKLSQKNKDFGIQISNLQQKLSAKKQSKSINKMSSPSLDIGITSTERMEQLKIRIDELNRIIDDKSNVINDLLETSNIKDKEIEKLKNEQSIKLRRQIFFPNVEKIKALEYQNSAINSQILSLQKWFNHNTNWYIYDVSYYKNWVTQLHVIIQDLDFKIQNLEAENQNLLIRIEELQNEVFGDQNSNIQFEKENNF